MVELFIDSDTNRHLELMLEYSPIDSWKLEHSDFISILNQSDILVLIETWKTNEKTIIMDTDSNFIEYNVIYIN